MGSQDVVLNRQGNQYADDWTETDKEFLSVMKANHRLAVAEIVLGSLESIQNRHPRACWSIPATSNGALSKCSGTENRAASDPRA